MTTHAHDDVLNWLHREPTDRRAYAYAALMLAHAAYPNYDIHVRDGRVWVFKPGVMVDLFQIPTRTGGLSGLIGAWGERARYTATAIIQWSNGPEDLKILKDRSGHLIHAMTAPDPSERYNYVMAHRMWVELAAE